jgi:rfaE bifunctional protein kinase chain/domain
MSKSCIKNSSCFIFIKLEIMQFLTSVINIYSEKENLILRTKDKKDYINMISEVKNILSQFKNKSILVIGDVMLDEYIWGNVDRISPEAPVPVVDVIREEYKLGGAGNVAKNLISLGAGKVYLSGVVGFDKAAEILIDLYKGSGIDVSRIHYIADRKTTLKTRILGEHQHVVRVDRESKCEISEDASRSILNIPSDIDAIIISDYGKGVINKQIMQGVVETKKYIVVDPKKRNFNIYENVDLITPNVKELSEGTGYHIINPDKDIHVAAEILYKKLKCKNVLVTRGSEGMSLFEMYDGGHKQFDIPTYAKKVFDVTGAGDSVVAAFTLSRLCTKDSTLACRIANVAAGIVVGEMGAVSPTVKEIIDYFDSITDHSGR